MFKELSYLGVFRGYPPGVDGGVARQSPSTEFFYFFIFFIREIQFNNFNNVMRIYTLADDTRVDE